MVTAVIGLWEFLILFFVILLLFGGRRFVAAARSLGRGAREFKESVTGKDEQRELPSDRSDPA